jgi:hypothetical protein
VGPLRAGFFVSGLFRSSEWPNSARTRPEVLVPFHPSFTESAVLRSGANHGRVRFAALTSAGLCSPVSRLDSRYGEASDTLKNTTICLHGSH